MAQHHAVTRQGLGLFDVSSALQKAVRRGDEYLALRCAEELFVSNYGEYCWKRLKIMVSEDIGLGEPNLPATILSLYQMYVEQTKKKDDVHKPERLFLYHAVILCVRAKKSRYVDWAVNYYMNTQRNEPIMIPDYCFDKHTSTGRKMGRGLKHFYEEGSKLNNMAIVDGEEEMKKRAWIASNKKEVVVEQTTMF